MQPKPQNPFDTVRGRFPLLLLTSDELRELARMEEAAIEVRRGRR